MNAEAVAATCPRCSRRFSVNATGLMRKHRVPSGDICRGSGRPSDAIVDALRSDNRRLEAENRALTGKLEAASSLLEIVREYLGASS